MPSKILIVDDEPEMREMVGGLLLKNGYLVEEADNGLDALRLAQAWLPDLILLDLVVPSLDGTAVCELLRKLPSTASIPVFMVSGCATDASKLIASLRSQTKSALSTC